MQYVTDNTYLLSTNYFEYGFFLVRIQLLSSELFLISRISYVIFIYLI